jgi:Tfp pilus assembly protein PilX
LRHPNFAGARIGARTRQQGSVLFVGLILLVAMTMIALASVKTGTTQLRVVGNVQAVQRVEAAAQLGIEEVMGHIDAFTDPAKVITVGNLPQGIEVVISERRCLSAVPAAGYSAVAKISPEDTLWSVEAKATDSLTGATATVSQGVRVRMLAGSCV